ncbi:unnamed protein product [Ambrosiozyma monospora]|uniref:Unnamed protein product n=1 Tax=Ambrosiozyma monospora TaxID=43982 RepID=A0ACB5T8S9_AMBMO|nr:unnamed protein product [Ambrosiozyma monospora]
MFDTVDIYKSFGPLVIEYDQAQSRVNAQYDHWQKQLASEFVVFLNVSHKVSLLKQGQLVLQDLRYKFQKDWLFHEQVGSDYESLEEAIDKRTILMTSQITSITKMIQEAFSDLSDDIEKAKSKWVKDKPIGNKVTQSAALSNLFSFENTFNTLFTRVQDIVHAANFLNFDYSLDLDLSDEMEEINELRSVWTSISELSKSLDKLGQQKWKDVTLLSLRRSLEDILTSSRSMPIAVRQYSSFEDIQENIKSLLRSITVLKGLKNDAVKKSHWDIIFMQLALKPAPDNLRLHDVFQLNIASNVKFLKTVIERAQSEDVINTSLAAIEKSWNERAFELFQYSPKYRIVKGWTELFNHCTDDLNSLSSMKLSPYFESFEKRVSSLEEQLNTIYALLDTWIDVQRQWVYLAGVFDKNEEIKRLLPIESTRFTNTTSEFFTLLKPVYKSLLVMEILSIRDMQAVLIRISDTLKSVVKSLMGYLEKQREQWPRFYFIEDVYRYF